MDNRGSSTGLPPNIAGLLAYAFGFVSGAVLLAIEKENDDVRFHAMQSVVVFVALFAASVGSSFIPMFGWIIALLVAPLQIIMWIVLMYQAFSSRRWKAPIAGDIAESLLAKHFPPSPPAAS